MFSESLNEDRLGVAPLREGESIRFSNPLQLRVGKKAIVKTGSPG